MEFGPDIMEFLSYLEFQTACSIEVKNPDFGAKEELIYKKTIHLN